MTLRSYQVRVRSLSTTKLTKIDIHDVSRDESLDQASTVFDETNSNIPKMLKMVRYGKVFYFNKVS